MNGPAAHVSLKVGAARARLEARMPSKSSDKAAEICKWDADAAMDRYEAERLRDAASVDCTIQSAVA